jgi:hypothetical protein
MPDTRVRVVGSGYTTFNYKGLPIAFLEQVQDSGQAPVGTPFEAITPLGHLHPTDIVTQRVLGVGTIAMSIRELWNEPVWWQLAGLEGTDTIGDVFERLRQEPSFVTCTKIIQPPNGAPPRGLQYHNCVVTAIDDGDTITTASLSVARNISLAYTHKTRL